MFNLVETDLIGFSQDKYKTHSLEEQLIIVQNIVPLHSCNIKTEYLKVWDHSPPTKIIIYDWGTVSEIKLLKITI